MIDEDRFFVLTGGPGAGKSTLVDALEQAGYARSTEAGRAIIRDHAAIDGPALPWRDRARFAEAMLDFEMRSHHAARRAAGPVFFDRGVPDVIGYLNLCGLPVPDHVLRAAERFRYNAAVFVLPPWREIFRQDEERRQDFAEAVRTHESLVAAYEACGYRRVELPKASVETRLAFILDRALDRASANR